MNDFNEEDLIFLEKLKIELLKEKETEDYKSVFEKENPLVSTITTTYNS